MPAHTADPGNRGFLRFAASPIYFRRIIVKKISLLICLSLICSFAFTGCSKQVKTDTKPAFDVDAWVKASNKQLEKVPVEGFEYKSSKVPAQNWDKWAVTAAPVVSGIISKMPDGYVLQIVGHTDGRGPEEPVGDKPGNIKISTDRAKSVYNSLAKKGITSPKLTYKGAGSAEPLQGVDPRDASQRRVTFVVAPKN